MAWGNLSVGRLDAVVVLQAGWRACEAPEAEVHTVDARVVANERRRAERGHCELRTEQHRLRDREPLRVGAVV